MDVLTDIVESVRLTSAIHGRWEFSAPWGLVMDGFPAHACFYVVTRGMARLEVADCPDPVHMAGSDFVLLTQGQKHVIKDSAATRPEPSAAVLRSCTTRRQCQPGGVYEYGGGGARTTIVSGCFAFGEADNPLVAALPPVMHVTSDEGPPRPWLEASLQFMADEMAAGQPGAETVVGRLADILLVQGIRAHLSQGGGSVHGWLRALSDPQIGEALGLIHASPAEPWTVESLAARVAMSRSAFAARFSHLVGEPPLTYLTRWRIHRASRLLATSHLRVHEIAAKVGYETESAFHKAFKRATGVGPSAWRREKQSRRAYEGSLETAS